MKTTPFSPIPPEKVRLASETGPLTVVVSTAQGAAQYLANKAPIRSEEQWLAWVYNNAKPSRRVNYRIPFQKRLNRTSYKLSDLDHVVKIEMYLANKGHLSAADQEWLDAHAEPSAG